MASTSISTRAFKFFLPLLLLLLSRTDLLFARPAQPEGEGDHKLHAIFGAKRVGPEVASVCVLELMPHDANEDEVNTRRRRALDRIGASPIDPDTMTKSRRNAPASTTATDVQPVERPDDVIIPADADRQAIHELLKQFLAQHHDQEHKRVARSADPNDAGDDLSGLVRSDYDVYGGTYSQFFDTDPNNDVVVFRYNPADSPLPSNDALDGLLNVAHTWSSVQSSKMRVQAGSLTTACPSLVDECDGKQKRDGHNDLAWIELASTYTLGVTWSIPGVEADIALNTKFVWSTSSSGEFRKYDYESVLLHEVGHALGLDHSKASSNMPVVMQPSIAWGTVRRELSDDDKAGISFLYPGGTGDIGDTNPTTVATTATTTTTKAASTTTPAATGDTPMKAWTIIQYKASKDKLRFISVVSKYNGDKLPGASMEIEILRDGQVIMQRSRTSNDKGKAVISITEPQAGHYTLRVVGLSLDGYWWNADKGRAEVDFILA